MNIPEAASHIQKQFREPSRQLVYLDGSRSEVTMLERLFQRQLSGRSVPHPGVDHVEFHHIPPSPCSRESFRRGRGHEQETQLSGVAAEEEKERSVCRCNQFIHFDYCKTNQHWLLSSSSGSSGGGGSGGSGSGSSSSSSRV